MVWKTDDLGNRRFTSADAYPWALVARSTSPGEIIVETPRGEIDVNVTHDGVEVFGQESVGEGFVGTRFTIPWVIIQEIVRSAR